METRRAQGFRSSPTVGRMQHPQTQETRCVYHGTRCLVRCEGEGEIVCRVLGNVVGRVECSGAGGADERPAPSRGASCVPELLGSAEPKLRGRARKVYGRTDADRVWRQRIRRIAEHFGVMESVRSEVEFVFSRLRRNTGHRPSHILFFAFYNTCRDRGACVVNEADLRAFIGDCCNLRNTHSALKIYGMLAVDAKRLGLYSGYSTPGFYFNTFLNAASRNLGLDRHDREVLWRKARQKYSTFPDSMSEKNRTRGTFRAVLGNRVFESVRGDVRY